MYDVKMSDGSALNGTATLTFNVGASNAGKTATVYVLHGTDATAAGASKMATATVSANGSVTFTINGLSFYAITLGAAAPAADGSSTSPTTGANPMNVALAIAGVVVLAGGVVVARKKIAE